MNKNIINISAVATSVIAFGIGIANAVKYSKINKAIGSIASDVDLTVPEGIIKAAMVQATREQCKSIASGLEDDARKDINREVKKTIDGIYSDIENDVKSSLSEQITMLTLDRIEESVVNKVSKRLNLNSSDVASVVRSCTNAGMSSFDIERILEHMNL